MTSPVPSQALPQAVSPSHNFREFITDASGVNVLRTLHHPGRESPDSLDQPLHDGDEESSNGVSDDMTLDSGSEVEEDPDVSNFVRRSLGWTSNGVDPHPTSDSQYCKSSKRTFLHTERGTKYKLRLIGGKAWPDPETFTPDVVYFMHRNRNRLMYYDPDEGFWSEPYELIGTHPQDDCSVLIRIRSYLNRNDRTGDILVPIQFCTERLKERAFEIPVHKTFDGDSLLSWDHDQSYWRIKYITKVEGNHIHIIYESGKKWVVGWDELTPDMARDARRLARHYQRQKKELLDRITPV